MFSEKPIGIVLALALVLVGGTRADITTGLVGYWPLDGDTVDASGNGLDGTITGNVVPTTGRTGAADSAMLFDAEAVSYIDLGDHSEFQITGEMTLAAWVSLNSGTTNNGRIFTKFGLNNNKAWGLNIENESNGVRYPATLQISPDGSTIVGVNDTQSLPTDEWVHVAGVYRPATVLGIKAFLGSRFHFF